MIVNNPWWTQTCDCNDDNTSLPKEGIISLLVGTDTYVVAFGIPYITADYGFEELYIKNTTDGVNADTGLEAVVIAQSDTGFTLKLNGTPTTSNGKIYWKIKPRL